MHGHQILVIIHLLYRYSYYILYPLVVIEGPVITIIAGFLASTKFLHPFTAYLVIVAGNITGDILYYYAGKFWFKKAYRRISGFFKISEGKLKRLELQLKKNSGKVIFFGKLSHFLSGLILVSSGVVGVPFGEYLFYCVIAELPKSLILFEVGFIFGSAITNFGKYVNFTIIGLVFLSLVFVGIYFGVTYISNKFLKKLEK